MASAPRLVQIDCPNCKIPHWIIDSDFREGWSSDFEEKAYEEREYICPYCNKKTTGFIVLQKSPSGFLHGPDSFSPMSREVFNHWLSIFKENLPDSYEAYTKYSDLRPYQPKIRQLVEASLPIMSFLCKMQQKEGVTFGDEVKKLDWPCLCLIFEYHLRRELSLEFETCKQSLLEYYTGKEVEILSEKTLREIVSAFWGYTLKFLRMELGLNDLYHNLRQSYLFHYDRLVVDAIDLFTDTYLPESSRSLPKPEKWEYVSTELIKKRYKHRRNTPLEELI